MPETLVLVPGLNCTPALFAAQIAALGSDCDILLADNSRDETMAGIARRLLAAAPERVTRLALLDTNAAADGPERREARAKQIAMAGEGRFREVVDEMWPRMVHPDRLSDPELRRIYDQMAKETGPEAFVRQLRSIMGRRDSRPMLPSIRVPTLVLVGDEDRLTPPEQSREMAALIPGARLVVVPESGHLSTLERADGASAALRDWLAA